MNLALRYAIDKARKNSMPRDNIERAIKKGCGDLGPVDYVELTYEGYGPHGVAVMCDALTENRNRTGGDIRRAFEVHGGNLGATGCVAWMFERKGLFTVPVNQISEDKLFEIALEAGADDVQQTGECYEITCRIDVFSTVSEKLEAHQVPTETAELTRIPGNTVELDLEQARQVLKLLEVLEENEDVQSVTANFNIPDDIMETLANEES